MIMLDSEQNEIVKEIFREIDSIFNKYYNNRSQNSSSVLVEMLSQGNRFIVNEMRQEISELEKKYIK